MGHSDDVRKVVLAALASALDDRKEEVKKKPGLTGVRAVATGAVIYTAGRAAFSGGRFIREHFGSDGRPDESDDRASEDEEFEDEEYDGAAGPKKRSTRTRRTRRSRGAEEDEEPEDEE